VPRKNAIASGAHYQLLPAELELQLVKTTLQRKCTYRFHVYEGRMATCHIYSCLYPNFPTTKYKIIQDAVCI